VSTEIIQLSRELLRQLSELLRDWVTTDALALIQQSAQLAGQADAIGASEIVAVSVELAGALQKHIKKSPSDEGLKQLGALGHQLKNAAAKLNQALMAGLKPTASSSQSSATANPLVKSAAMVLSASAIRCYFLADADPESMSVSVPELLSAMVPRDIALQIFYDGDALALALNANPPHILLSEAAFVPALSDMLETLERDRPGLSLRMPVVALNRNVNPTRRLMAGLGGADEYLEAPNAMEVAECILHLHLSCVSDEAPYQILIVDDDRQQAMFCAGVLKRKGMQVTSALSADEALSALTSMRPDLVIMDLYLPGINGLELTAILRQRSDSLVLPIVFLSGEQDTQKRFDALNIGGDDYLTKPIRPRHLATAVASRVKRVRALRAQLSQMQENSSSQGVVRRANFLELLFTHAKQNADTVNALGLYYVSLDARAQLMEDLGLVAQSALETELLLRLTATLEQGDVLTSLGGFDYALLARRNSEERSTAYAEALRQSAFAREFVAANAVLSFSVGIAPQHCAKNDAERWLNLAHMAAQRAELAGGNRCERGFNEPVAPKPERARMIDAMLADAPNRNNTNVQYSPLVPLRGAPISQYFQQLALRGETIATANVVRSDYAASAERLGAMPRLDRYALSRALEAIRESARLGGSVMLFVPCAVQSLSGALVQALKLDLAHSSSEARALILQLDLHAIELELAAVLPTLAELKRLGIRLALNVHLARANLRLQLSKLAPDFLLLHTDLFSEKAMPRFAALQSALQVPLQNGCQLVALDVVKLEQLNTLWNLNIDYFSSALLAPARMQFDFAFSPFQPK